jgi:AcrR family transcriptional regulator
MRRKSDTAHAMNGVRTRILASAKELFVQQGYKKTTIRQIVQHSGILTGSIYYFFKNKEDIFQALILSLLRQCIYLINKNFAEKSPAFKYAAMCMVEFKAVEINEWARESYFEGYTSIAIFEKMVDHVASNTIDMFKNSKNTFSDEEYFQRSLLIKGAMRSYVSQLYFHHHTDQQQFLELLIYTSLDLLAVDEEEIQAVIADLKTEGTVIEAIAQRLIDQSITK